MSSTDDILAALDLPMGQAMLELVELLAAQGCSDEEIAARVGKWLRSPSSEETRH